MIPFIRDRRDMEPRDAFLQFQLTSHVLPMFYMLLPIAACISRPKAAVLIIRLRGGTESSDPNYNVIKELSSKNFMWNGIPTVDFNEKIKRPLDAGLGSLTEKNDTLLRCAERKDKGGVLGDPPRSTAGTDDIEASDARNRRLFAVLANYIHSTSEVYNTLHVHFIGEGVAAYRYIIEFGNIPTPSKVREVRENSFREMTMDKLRLPHNQEGYFKWAEIVQQLGRKINKDADRMTEKFVQGLPIFFNAFKAQMEKDRSNPIESTYRLLRGFSLAPDGADAHPFHGQQDHNELARSYLPQWTIACC